MNVRRLLLIGVMALVVMSCQSGTTAETTATTAAPVATTDASDDTRDPGSVASMDDMPAECVEALREYLRAIEPIVEGVDFQSLSGEDFEALGEELADAEEGLDERVESCPELDVTVDESFTMMREFAEDEAPGTVAYFNYVEEFFAGFEGVDAGSGDCETDIAAFQVFVDRGGSMSDLTASEVATASGLMSSIAAACSDERFLEWSEDEDIQAWISGSG